MTEQSDAPSTEKVHRLLSRETRKIGFAIDANIYIVSKSKDGQTKEVKLDQVPIKRLQTMVKREFDFLVPDVWWRETVGHLSGSSKAKLDEIKAMKPLPAWLNAPELGHAFSALQKATQAGNSDALAVSAWEKFVQAANAIRVETPADIGADVIDRYFASQPPFGKPAEKKHEFPDAFALLALERYESDQGYDAIVVVTKDDGPLSYCSTSSKLIAFRDLGLALAAFDSVDAINALRELSVQWSGYFEAHRDQLMDAVVEVTNASYSHQQMRWRGIDSALPDLQSPRVLIREVVEVQLAPFGAFNLPVQVAALGPGGELWGTARLNIKARLAGEVSARAGYRTSFELSELVQRVIDVGFIAQVQRDVDSDESSVTRLTIRDLIVDPVSFRTPADIETGHWA